MIISEIFLFVTIMAGFDLRPAGLSNSGLQDRILVCKLKTTVTPNIILTLSKKGN